MYACTCTHTGGGGEPRRSPGPPGLQQCQQHLDPTHEDGRAPLPLQHVAQELINGLLPGAGAGASRRRARDSSPPCLGGPATHFSRVASSWSGSGLSCTWIICSRLRRMMSHRDWDAKVAGEGERAEDPGLPWRQEAPRTGGGHLPSRTEGRTDRGKHVGGREHRHWEGETAERKGNQRRLPGKGDSDTNPTHAIYS